MDRRSFITLTSSLIASCSTASLVDKRSETASTDPTQFEEPWHTLAIVLEHLFPGSDDSPGAGDIQALQFIRAMLATPDADPDDIKFIKNGVGWLNDVASKNHSDKFSKLSPQNRENVLRQIERSQAGERWLSLLLTYLIEALLSDPVYGGNPDGIGWKWLEHQPGFPRPTAEKVYYKLGKPRYTRTKA